MGQSEHSANLLRAGLWMLGAVASFSTLALAGRSALKVELDTFELLLFRSIVGVIIILGVASAKGMFKDIQTQHLRLHLVRNIAHFTGQNLWFFALTLIPLAQLFALEFTTPLWVIALAPFVLGEKITSTRALAAALGFVGILIIARPGTTPISAGVIAAAACAIFFALTAVFTKRLTRDVPIISILFWLTVMQGLLGLLCAGIDGAITVPSAQSILPVILVGFCGLSAHFCLTMALSLAPSVVVMSMDFSRLPIIAVIGMALYAEPLEWAVFSGAALIFLGNFINMKAESRQ